MIRKTAIASGIMTTGGKVDVLRGSKRKERWNIICKKTERIIDKEPERERERERREGLGLRGGVGFVDLKCKGKKTAAGNIERSTVCNHCWFERLATHH